MTLLPPPPTLSWPLQLAGPAQFDCLIHFCGRAQGAKATPCVPGDIASSAPDQRLDAILWEEHLRGFPPFGADWDQPMICLSESPPAHLSWLVGSRGWPPWGLIFSRQFIYDIGGGPAWHARSSEYETLGRDHRRWAVRLDTTPGRQSDWLFEREWRVPVPSDNPALHVTPHNLTGILIGDPDWQPSRRMMATGMLVDGRNGELAFPGNPYSVPEMRMGLPTLWETAQVRVYWDPDTNGLADARGRS